MNNGDAYFIQILFVTGIAIGSQILNLQDKQVWFNVARYAIYLLTIQLVPAARRVLLRLRSRQLRLPDLVPLAKSARGFLFIYLGSAALLLLSEQKIFDQDFVFIFLGYLIVKYPEMAEAPPEAQTKASISYGVGMACSYFEGYLVHVLPSDGARFVGFEENIRALEDNEGVLFPVKKMFIIITKSMYSPPDLKDFNRGTDVPYMEAFNSLAGVKKSVAGVRNRIYRNTAYKIYRPTPPAAPAAAPTPPAAPAAAPTPPAAPAAAPTPPAAPAAAPTPPAAPAAAPTPPAAPSPPPRPPPVCLAAECATPLHTLYRVLNNRTLYNEVADIVVEDVVSDFCSTLRSILERSHECRGKCELVYYDHEDPNQNLAQILLDRVRELEPDFEKKIIARREENKFLDQIATLEMQ